MFCRRIWHRVGPLAQKLFSPVSRTTVPVRRMAFGVPGGSTNMTYFVLCGGGLTAAVVYAYKTVNGDTERYEDRLANMNSQAKVEEAPEAAAPAAELAASEEEPASESVPVEPAAEISAEPVDEAAAVEVVVTEASSVSEEAAPVVVEEGAPEAAPEVPAEAPAAESAGTTAVDEILPVPASGAETPSEAEADPGPAADVTA